MAGGTVGTAALTAIVAYLLGSISFAVLTSKLLHKDDVRAHGSGNAGMTNMLRTYGKLSAVLTLVGDAGKGAFAVFCGKWLFLALAPGVDFRYGKYIAAVFVIVGHMLPLFFKFKGGKGLATSGGAILALHPLVCLILVCIFLALALSTGMVSLGAVVGMSLFPAAELVYGLVYSHFAVAFTVVCALCITGMVLWAHRGNIGRIKNGTEYRFGKRFKR